MGCKYSCILGNRWVPGASFPGRSLMCMSGMATLLSTVWNWWLRSSRPPGSAREDRMWGRNMASGCRPPPSAEPLGPGERLSGGVSLLFACRENISRTDDGVYRRIVCRRLNLFLAAFLNLIACMWAMRMKLTLCSNSFISSLPGDSCRLPFSPGGGAFEGPATGSLDASTLGLLNLVTPGRVGRLRNAGIL